MDVLKGGRYVRDLLVPFDVRQVEIPGRRLTRYLISLGSADSIQDPMSDLFLEHSISKYRRGKPEVVFLFEIAAG